MATSKKSVLAWGCLGCGGVFLLGVLLVVGTVSYLGYKGYQFGKETEAAYRELGNGYQTLNASHDFHPPEDNVMDPDRAQTYVDIRGKISRFLADYISRIEQQGEQISAEFTDSIFSGIWDGIREIKTMIRLAAHITTESGREHLRLLREAEMSMTEFRWLTHTYLGTLAKSKENNFEPGTRLWEDYRTALQEASQEMTGVNVDTGHFKFDRDSLDWEKLNFRLRDVPFRPENAEIISTTADAFRLEPAAIFVDYFTMESDSILPTGRRSPPPDQSTESQPPTPQQTPEPESAPMP